MRIAIAVGILLGIAGGAVVASRPAVRPDSPIVGKGDPQPEYVPGLKVGDNPQEVEDDFEIRALNDYATAWQRQQDARSDSARKAWQRVESEYLLLVDAQVDRLRLGAQFKQHSLDDRKIMEQSQAVSLAVQDFLDIVLDQDRLAAATH